LARSESFDSWLRGRSLPSGCGMALDTSLTLERVAVF
jgi:hypothetical protein